MNKWCEKEIKELIEAISSLDTWEEASDLLDVVATPREINDMARRLKIAKMLGKNVNYSDIVAEMGVSSHTISRVAASIGLGFCRGNKLFLGDGPKTKKTFKVEGSKIKYKGARMPVLKINQK